MNVQLRSRLWYRACVGYSFGPFISSPYVVYLFFGQFLGLAASGRELEEKNVPYLIPINCTSSSVVLEQTVSLWSAVSHFSQPPNSPAISLCHSPLAHRPNESHCNHCSKRLQTVSNAIRTATTLPIAKQMYDIP